MTLHRIPSFKSFSWQNPVIDVLISPPISPNNGDRYIVGIGATGAWAASDNFIATYSNFSWIYDFPLMGWVCWVSSVTAYYSFNGTTWVRNGSIYVKTTEIDFGNIPVSDGVFYINDSEVKPTSMILGSISYTAPTGKDLDELEMDAIDLKFGSSNGQLIIFAKGLEGYVEGKFKVNYLIG